MNSNGEKIVNILRIKPLQNPGVYMEKNIDSEILEKRKHYLQKAVDYHGHLCLGQVLGVHLAEKGMEVIGTNDPKKMIVYVENDRCIADAIQILTGTRLGRRSMKLVNYGKMAATFINTDTGAAYRVWVSGKINEMIGKVNSNRGEKERQYNLVLQSHSNDVVSVQKVIVDIPPEDLPGKPKRTVACVQCGEKVMDGKDISSKDGPLCLACAKGPYYTLVTETKDAIGE